MMQIFHDARCAEYARSGHPERPERIVTTVPFLKRQHPDWRWTQPETATTEQLLLAHSAEHLAQVADPRAVFDSDCPTYPHSYDHAARATGAALAAARAAVAGERAFSLMRPPGHHAMRERVMGFCYFNHISIAAFDAIAAGVERVAILDVDAHHGNGTEALVAEQDKIEFASIHQYPGWPGTGTRSFDNIYNFPVAPFSPRAEHVRTVRRALDTLLKFRPELLLVSAGFDAYRDDPITQMTLETEDFAIFGQWLRETDVPAAAILEGGYSDELPALIDAFLTAWAG